MPLSIGRDSRANSSWPASHSPFGPIFQAADGAAAGVSDGAADGIVLTAGTGEVVTVFVAAGVVPAGPAHPATTAMIMTLTR